jgi:predicted transcriptional regulator
MDQISNLYKKGLIEKFGNPIELFSKTTFWSYSFQLTELGKQEFNRVRKTNEEEERILRENEKLIHEYKEKLKRSQFQSKIRTLKPDQSKVMNILNENNNLLRIDKISKEMNMSFNGLDNLFTPLIDLGLVISSEFKEDRLYYSLSENSINNFRR